MNCSIHWYHVLHRITLKYEKRLLNWVLSKWRLKTGLISAIGVAVPWCIVWSIERFTAYGHPLECHETFGIGCFILFDKIPVSTILLPKRLHVFQSSLDISLPKLIWKSHRPQNTRFIRGPSPYVSSDEYGILLVGNRKFVIWKFKSSRLSLNEVRRLLSFSIYRSKSKRNQKRLSTSCLWSQAQ